MAEVEPALPPFGERPNEAVILKTEFRVGDHQQLRKVVKCNVAYLQKLTWLVAMQDIAWREGRL